MCNEIKNCNWECSQTRDGECLYFEKWMGSCDCETCECFFDCSACKLSGENDCYHPDNS